MCQQTLDFDDAVDATSATSEGIQKEKFLPQGTVHKIAREEASKQYRRDFTRLKQSIEASLNNKFSKKKPSNQPPNKQNNNNNNKKKKTHHPNHPKQESTPKRSSSSIQLKTTTFTPPPNPPNQPLNSNRAGSASTTPGNQRRIQWEDRQEKKSGGRGQNQGWRGGRGGRRRPRY